MFSAGIVSLALLCATALAFQEYESPFSSIEKRQCAIDCATMGSTCSPCSKRTVADFVLIIDCSSSMQDNIDAVNAGMQNFVAAIAKRDIEAHFLVILNGVKPEVLVDWTTDGAKVQHVLSGVNAGGPCNGCKQADVTHFNHDCTGCSTREAPFEPILMALGVAGANGSGRQIIDRNPMNKKYAPGTGAIQFHPDSRKFFIVLTDENADCPHYEQNRFKTPAGAVPKCFEPPNEFPTAKTGTAADVWIDEIDYTVNKVIAADASVHIFCDRSRKPSINQYGDPQLQSQNGDFSNFNEADTLKKLNANAATKNSFQAKAIRAKKPQNTASYRVFDVNLVTQNNGKNVDNFFSQVVESVDAGCFLRRKRQTVNKVPCNKYECHCSGCKTIPLCNAGCEQCMIDGKCYAPFEKNPANGCQQCLPAKSKNSWSGCDDANDCTTDTCTAGQCVYSPICTAKCNLCTIDGGCVPSKGFKQNDPMGSDCYWCNPSCSDTQWTPTGFCAVKPPPECGGAAPTPPPPAPSCEDTIMNQGETGVDCGGPCKACDLCANNIKDANELGVDCGPSCPVKTCADATADGTCSDNIRQATEQCTDCGGRCPNPCSAQQLAACGMAQPTDGVPSGTCMDGTQNLGEAGIDCGGRCPTACVPPATGFPGTCTDGLQNYGETGVDCGGRCVQLGGRACSFDTVTPTCTDGIKNQGEAGTDCGGPCPNPCATCTLEQFQACTTACQAVSGTVTACDCVAGVPTPVHHCSTDAGGSCSDGVVNGGELGIDCGGRCPNPCADDMLLQSCTTEELNTCFTICSPRSVASCDCTPQGASAVCPATTNVLATALVLLFALALLF